MPISNPAADEKAAITEHLARLDQLTHSLGILRVGVQPDTPGARLSWLGKYDPRGPSGPVIALLDDLSPIEQVVVWTHEMAHVYRHPPGSPADGAYEHDQEPEERVVHAAAAEVCKSFQLGDYRQIMQAKNVPHVVPLNGLRPDEVSAVTAVANALCSALNEPDRHPGWQASSGGLADS